MNGDIVDRVEEKWAFKLCASCGLAIARPRTSPSYQVVPQELGQIPTLPNSDAFSESPSAISLIVVKRRRSSPFLSSFPVAFDHN